MRILELLQKFRYLSSRQKKYVLKFVSTTYIKAASKLAEQRRPKFVVIVENVKVQQAERKKKEAKDGRNLFLAREGMIREGTQVK